MVGSFPFGPDRTVSSLMEALGSPFMIGLRISLESFKGSFSLTGVLAGAFPPASFFLGEEAVGGDGTTCRGGTGESVFIGGFAVVVVDGGGCVWITAAAGCGCGFGLTGSGEAV